MGFLKSLLLGAFIALVVCAVVLPEGGDKPVVMDGLGKLIVAIVGFIAFGYALRVLRWWARGTDVQPREVQRIGRPIVVDGSNVMHWGGDPSMMVLRRVLGELGNRGYEPIVYFDANVGYKLIGEHLDARALAAQLGIPQHNIVVAPSRTPADPILIERAVTNDWRIVTNDRFLDWKQQFPKLGDRNFLVKGRWQQGSVILLGLGRG